MRSLPLNDDGVPKSAAIDPTLDENSIAALIEFFKLLDKWDKDLKKNADTIAIKIEDRHGA
jgi:hypothetical protein